MGSQRDLAFAMRPHRGHSFHHLAEDVSLCHYSLLLSACLIKAENLPVIFDSLMVLPPTWRRFLDSGFKLIPPRTCLHRPTCTSSVQLILPFSLACPFARLG